MGSIKNEDLLESASTRIFEIPGEPAIVINGLPPLPSSNGNRILCDASDTHSRRFVGFGEWLEGREVRKLFGEQFFNGKVTQFDEEMGWYRVVYEDGDYEDLDWQELQEVLVPIDVSIPLKTLATKVLKKQNSVQKTTKSKVKAGKDGSSDDAVMGKEGGVS